MKTAVRRVLLLSALLSPTALNALGLGEINLRSALNQPFDAEIELVSAAAEDLAALRASLASSETFTRYGLDRPSYLSDFSFRVERGADGRDVLRVTSPRPVTEPFVTLLVEANWPRGRLLREYTVLLDPPIFAPGPAASEPSVATPRAVAPAPPPRRTEAAAPSAVPAPREPRAQAPVAALSIDPGSAYRVQRNDTLWKIASAANPGSRSDVNRAMVAIYQSNPAAFDGNINILKAGSLLNIPTAAEMTSISASAAAEEVSRQYRVWREGTAAAGAPETGRLRLVTPEQGTPAASTATAQPAPAADAAAADLQSRVRQLESELAEARRLLEVRSAELATLQGQAPVTPPAAEPVAEGEAAAPVEPSVEPGAEPAAEPVAEEAPPAPVEEAPAPAEQPAVPAEEGPTLLERIAGYWWVLLGLLAAVLAFVLYRRSRGESGAAEEDLAAALARREPGDLRAHTAAVPKPREAEIVVEEQRPVEAAVVKPVPVHVAPEPSRKPVSIEDTLSGEAAVSLEAGDPLAEADFHMAYGLYDQAADLVQVAAKREPRRRDLKLKLLEIFFVWGNRDRFLEMARELNASRSEAQPGEWDKVLIMGKQIAPEDPLFAGAARPSAAALDMELHGATSVLDMDFGTDTAAIAEVDLTETASEGSDGVGLDFVIDEPVRGTEDDSALASTIEAALAPTIETARFSAAPSEEPTQEVAIEDLGLEMGDLQELGDVEGAEDVFAPPAQGALEDTVERTTIDVSADEESEEDLLSATSILKGETETLAAMAAADKTSVIDLSDVTGELPTIEATKLGGAAQEVDLPLGEESTTMSEVGTKLDLARAYIDMGDPEGARSILEEVLNEGNAAQKREAERLVASLP